MPCRTFLYRRLPSLLRIYRYFIQSTLFGCPGIIDFVSRRTAWFDRVLETAISDQGVKQVVIVASGFSTYTHRTTYSDVSFFEIDLPKAIKAKMHLVHQLGLHSSQVHYIPADLSQVTLDSALMGTGAFNPQVKSIFLIEGLLYYLPSSAVELLLNSITTCSAPGSMLAFDFLDQEVFDNKRFALGYHALRLIVAKRGEELKSGMYVDEDELRKKLALSSSLSSTSIFKPLQVLDAEKMASMTHKDEGRGRRAVKLPSFFHYCLAQAQERKYED